MNTRWYQSRLGAIGMILVAFAIIDGVALFRLHHSEPYCLGGYKFTATSNPVQILDDQGHGIKCEVKP